MSSEGLRQSLGAQLFDFVLDPIFLLDPGGVFLDINDAAARYLGRDPDQVIGRSVTDIFPPDQAGRQLEVLHEVIATGKPFLEERVTPIGEETFIFQYAVRRVELPERQTVAALGMVRDITRMVALERRYAELYENATDALFAIDTEGRIRALNREAEAMSGYSRDGVESVHFSQVIPPEELERLNRYFRDRLAGQDAPTEYETRYLHASGEERWAEVHISRETSSDGVFQASLRDVTARKRMELMRRDFLHMISHDVKTPLTVVQGFASALSSGLYGETSREQAECLDRIVDASKRVRHLMEQFLLAERIDSDEAWQPTAGSVSGALEGAAEAIRAEAEAKKVEFRVDAGEVAGLRVADSEGLRQILENLLSNALKFTERGGRISARAARDEGEVRIDVKDSGVGIPEAELGRIFDRFFRSSGSGHSEGSGLGLYIARRVAERLGGRIAVESRHGEGSQFTVWLPIAVDDGKKS